MKISTRALVAGGAVLAVALCCLAAGEGSAADTKALMAEIQKAAALLEKGDEEAAKKAAKDIATKYQLDDAMHAFGPRTKGGVGVGDKPGAIVPDCIETRFVNLGKKALAKPQLDKEAPALTRAAYVTAILGHVAIAHQPLKKEGNKDPKDWKQWSQDMIQASDALAKALKSKDPAAVKTAASTLNSSCNNCHGVFRDQ